MDVKTVKHNFASTHQERRYPLEELLATLSPLQQAAVWMKFFHYSCDPRTARMRALIESMPETRKAQIEAKAKAKLLHTSRAGLISECRQLEPHPDNTAFLEWICNA
jgi:DNA-directed RNA polymerase sigma subunit (sigma70/sigma32)